LLAPLSGCVLCALPHILKFGLIRDPVKLLARLDNYISPSYGLLYANKDRDVSLLQSQH
jgi:hypothetical protein